jgi:hypothetical protein
VSALQELDVIVLFHGDQQAHLDDVFISFFAEIFNLGQLMGQVAMSVEDFFFDLVDIEIALDILLLD